MNVLYPSPYNNEVWSNPKSTNHNCSRQQILRHLSQLLTKKGMIFHENRLPADDSHEISCLICYFGKSGKI